MKKIYLDANYFIAVLIQDHKYNLRAVNITRVFEDYKPYISILVMNEVIFSLHKLGYEKTLISRLLLKAIRNLNISMVERDSMSFEGEANYLEIWTNSNLKPSDACHLYYMKSLNIDSMVSFDSDFINNSDKLGIEVIH